MAQPEMIELRNKKTGEIIKVPRSQFVDRNTKQGLAGVGEDISQSLINLPSTAGEMIPQLATGAVGAGKNIFTHPVRSFMKGLAGVGEGAIAMEHIPANIAQYLADKGMMSQKDAETYQKYKIPDLGIEKRLGIDQDDEGDKFIKMLTSFLVPGKAAKALLPARVAMPAAASALAAGDNQDPLQAAILAKLVEHAAKKTGQALGKVPDAVNRAAAGDQPPPPPPGGAGGAPSATMPGAMPAPMNAGFPDSLNWIKNIPQAAVNVTKDIPQTAAKMAARIPEVAGSTTASALESTADYASKIPGVGGFVQPTIGALASYLKHLSVAPEEMAKRKLFGDITSEDMPKIDERLQAAERLGLSFLTPGEAMLSPFQTAKEANVGKTSSGAKLLYEKGKERVGTEAKAINNLLDTIYDEKTLAPEKQAAYRETMGQKLPNEFIEKWKKNPIVDWAINQMESKPTYKSELASVPKDSFEYWNIVKRVIGDLEKGEAKGMQGFSSNAATKIRNGMVDEMDALEPRYETARNIAEREFTRKDLENVFDKKNMTLNNFWSFLKSDKAFNKVMSKLAPFPDAQQKLRDIRLLSNEIIPFDESIRSSYKLEKTGMTKDRNKLDALKRDLDERFGKEHDVASVKLMTSPEWRAALMDYLAKHGR